MKLKVKHEELHGVMSTMRKDGDLYSVEIDKMLKLIDELRTIWQGQDSDQFCYNVSQYIEKMKKIPAALTQMSGLVEKANIGYSDNDEEFSKELQTEVDNYDETVVNTPQVVTTQEGGTL